MASHWSWKTVLLAFLVILLLGLCLHLYQSGPGGYSARDHSDIQFLKKHDYEPKKYSVVTHPDTQSLRKYDHEPEEYSAGDHPEMQFLRKHGHAGSLPEEGEIRTMSEKALLYTYHSYLDNTNFLCHRKIRMGKVGDGGWEVCDDYEYRPIKACIVYSFGINNDFSFDDEVSNLYQCRVYSFDPSMKTATHQRSERVFFYDIGIGGKTGQGTNRAATGGWHMESFSGIKKMLKHEQTMIDLVKMDVEHSEWFALPDMIESGELKHVRQFLVEFHESRGRIREHLLILKKLESLGFQRFHTHMNPACGSIRQQYPIARSNCYEVYFVNIHLARSRPLPPQHQQDKGSTVTHQ